MGDSERVVCKMESSFRMRNVGFSVFLTCILPCDLLMLKIYQVEGTILVSVHIFVNEINTNRLKR